MTGSRVAPNKPESSLVESNKTLLRIGANPSPINMLLEFPSLVATKWQLLGGIGRRPGAWIR